MDAPFLNIRTAFTHRPHERRQPKLHAMSSLIQTARRFRKDGTLAERCLWQRLRANQVEGHCFRRQQPLGPFIVDFACLPRCLVVEIDGSSHDAKLDQDRERTAYLEARGYRVIRFSNEQVLTCASKVVEAIRLYL